MPVIVWITDVPGWAYDNRAVNLSLQMSGYQHRIVCYSSSGFNGFMGADIVVCPDPRILKHIPKGPFAPKVVLNLNAVKIFEDRHGCQALHS